MHYQNIKSTEAAVALYLYHNVYNGTEGGGRPDVTYASNTLQITNRKSRVEEEGAKYTSTCSYIVIKMITSCR